MKLSKIIGVGAAVLALTTLAACATTEPPPSREMPMGGFAFAPQGFAEFCEARPEHCEGWGGGEPATMAEAATAEVTHATPGRAAPRQVAELEMQAVLTEFFRQRAAAAGPPPPPPPATLALTPQSWSLIRRINDEINAAIAPSSDADLYGVEERWTLPLDEGSLAGDCEDYVLEKRRALIAAGIDPAALSIAVVVTNQGVTHAVLLVRTDKGEYVLDNLTPWVEPWDRREFTWLKRQYPGRPDRWVSLRS